jgi:predicted XRE-type DNA-binding protein
MKDIEISSGNIYADLGLPHAGDMLIKAQLAAKIGEIIKSKRLTQQEAAEIIGIPQPKLSGMLRGQFRGISETKMIESLTRLGRDVKIVIGSPKRSRAPGQMAVVFA